MYSNEIKNKILEEINSGEELKIISLKYDISMSTLYRWKKENSNTNKIDISDIINEIHTLINMKKFNEALTICNEYPNQEKLQFLKRSIIIKYEHFLSYKITILTKQNKLDEALTLCDEFPNNINIQNQKISILIKLNKYNEALAICDYFPNNKSFQSRKTSILNIELSKTLTYIYYNSIKLEEIMNLNNISKRDKYILLCAYYEKHNKNAGIALLKSLKNKNIIDNKTINILLERLKSKKIKIFDVGLYSKILKCKIIDTLALNILNEQSNILIKDLFKTEVNIILNQLSESNESEFIKNRFITTINKSSVDKEALKDFYDLVEDIIKCKNIDCTKLRRILK